MDANLERQLNQLNRLYKESEEIYRGLASHFGLSDTAFWILYAITHADGPCTQNDLCQAWFYPVQTINSAVAKLRKKGLVYLEVIPGTRNRKMILLTKRGEEFAERVISRVDEMETQAFLQFSEAEREVYLTLFQRHLENLRKEEKRVMASLGVAEAEHD